MKRKRRTPEQIIAKLREADGILPRGLQGGQKIARFDRGLRRIAQAVGAACQCHLVVTGRLRQGCFASLIGDEESSEMFWS